MIVTIDGPAGSGKGTVASYLAEAFNLKHLDTGLLFRAAGYHIQQKNIDLSDLSAVIVATQTITIDDTKNPNLRCEDVASIASCIAKIHEVRQILGKLQKDFSKEPYFPFKGVVLDGRDIGTVICPEAPCKLFITADLAVRTQRRLLELEQSDEEKEKIFQKLQVRDTRDQSRETAPLLPAKDAFIIDTTHLTVHQVCEIAADYVKKNCLNRQVA